MMKSSPASDFKLRNEIENTFSEAREEFNKRLEGKLHYMVRALLRNVSIRDDDEVARVLEGGSFSISRNAREEQDWNSIKELKVFPLMIISWAYPLLNCKFTQILGAPDEIQIDNMKTTVKIKLALFALAAIPIAFCVWRFLESETKKNRRLNSPLSPLLDKETDIVVTIIYKLEAPHSFADGQNIESHAIDQIMDSALYYTYRDSFPEKPDDDDLDFCSDSTPPATYTYLRIRVSGLHDSTNLDNSILRRVSLKKAAEEKRLTVIETKYLASIQSTSNFRAFI